MTIIATRDALKTLVIQHGSEQGLSTSPDPTPGDTTFTVNKDGAPYLVSVSTPTPTSK